MKAIFFAALLLLGTASAAPLLGTKDNVYSGNFCNKYGCKLFSYESLSKSDGIHKLYDFKLQDESHLIITRSPRGILNSAVILFAEYPVANDFVHSFFGESEKIDRHTCNSKFDVKTLSRDIKGGVYVAGCFGALWKVEGQVK